MKRLCGSSLASFGPGADQVVVHGRAARRAAIGRFPFHEGKHIGNFEQLVGLDGITHRLMAVFGAAAHGLGFGRGRVVAAGGEHQQLLDQSGAGAAGGAGLGVFAHFVEREQAFFLDDLADRALGHTVAAADLVAVFHDRGLVVALVAGVADVGFTEHQLVADVGNGPAITQQLEVPAAVHRVAVQAGAH